MRRHLLIKKLQEPYCLFLWSFLWWGKNISSKTPIWFLHDCISPLKAYACNQSFLPFEILKEIATCCTVFIHLQATWFYNISHDLSSHTVQAPAPGKAHNPVRVWAGGGWAGEQHWCPGAPWAMQDPAVPRQQEHGPSFKGWNYPPLLHTDETTARYNVWFWDPLNTRCGQTGVSSARAPS